MTQHEDDGWRCEKCGQHMIWHGLRQGVPVCPEKQEKPDAEITND